MKFQLRYRSLATIVLTVLTIALAFFFVKPVSADNTVIPTTVTQPTNQPNAPNATRNQTALQSSSLVENSQQANQSTSSTSDVANANKSVNTAATPAENVLSSDKANDQSRQTAVTRSNNSQTLNSQENSNNVILQEAQAAEATNSAELTPKSFTVKITDANGNEIPADQPHQINQYTPVNIQFDFDLTGQNVHPGDYFGFVINNPGDRLSIQKTTIQLDNASGQNIGVTTLESSNGQINGRVTLNVTGSDVSGQFLVQLKVDTSKSTSGDDIPVTVTLPDNHQITATFHYLPGTDDPEERFSKYSYNSVLGPDKSNPAAQDPNYYTPDDITKGNLTYALRLIHHNGDAQYTQATVTDELQTPGFTYDKDSFLLYKTHWTYVNGQWQTGTLTNIPAKSTDDPDGYSLTINPGERSFTMDFGTPKLADGDGYVIFYRLLYDGQPVNKITNVDDKPANGTIIHNQAELVRPNNSTITYPQTMQISGSDGKADVKYFSVTVKKTDEKGNALSGATFQLRQNDKVIQTGTTDSEGKITFGNLLRGDYTLRESSAPAGYSIAADVQIKTGDFKDYSYSVTVKDVPVVTSVTVKKVWDDNNNQDGVRPDAVQVQLKQTVNGQTTNKGEAITLNESNKWTYTWNNLPQYQAGKLVTYTWQEVDVPAGYQVSVDGDIITNTHIPATITKTVTKVWVDNDNQDGLRKAVKVNLLADGKVVKTVELTAANNWTTKIDGLAQKANGQDINYTWQEADVPAGYQVSVDGDTITNTHIPATISKTVTKVWVDNDNQDGLRKAVKVNLLADGKIVKTVELTAANNWTTKIDGLAQKANGQDIAYTWQEADVPAGYQAKVDGNTITNTHIPATITKTVTKQWVDNDNQDGLRPASINVNLLANGQVVKMVELTATNNWTATIAGLAEKANGQTINYTWEEADVPAGYQATIDGDLITNTHTPVTISKTVTKQWVDNNDQDGIRPESVKVNLLANGQVVKTVELTAAKNWTVTIDGLAQKTNGQDITYTWEEAELPAGYQATVKGDTVINTHTPATISKTVTKQWVDNDNQDGIRPESVKVNLLANGQVVKTVELTATNNWTATVDSLAEKANGQTITYTWEEADIPAGYQASVKGDTITNTHTPVTITKTVTKQWSDNDNQDGIRPESVKINLLANGQVVKTVELTAAKGWTATIDGLAQKANGQDIAYTWEEADVPAGYQVSVDGNTITNTHTPATISKTVTKQWIDNDNQDGIRPGSVKINLLANGQVGKTVELSSANNWTATINDLAEKANGNDIIYTWEEADVPAGYQASVKGDMITNTHTPATITKTVTKQWADNDDQDGIRPESIKANLLANGKVVETVELTAANHWTAKIDGLAQKANGQDIAYTWQEADVPAGYQAKVDGNTIINTHTPATITKTVTKQWVDNDDQDGIRPGSIKVNLLANGQVVKTVELTATNHWTATVDGLAEKAAGQDINYAWEEADIPAGYQASVDGNTITNTHTPATITKTVTKQWIDNDNQDGIRPASINVNLLANGQVVKMVELTATNNWTATIAGLAEKANGQTINYTWEEADVPAGYQATVDGDLITNAHTPATITKTVTKQWVDNDNQDGIRPGSVKVNLLANGQVVKTVELTAANNWTATINDLAEKANGQNITYTWEEAELPAGYQASVDGDTITNTHTPATITKTVTKQWIDNDNQDGIRPSSIKVNLLANGQVVKTVELTAANGWTATIDGLAEKANGQDITYTWEEADIPAGYQATVDGDLITNTHIPATITKTVTKQWVDNDNQDGIRPESIKVNLLANGQVVKTIELTTTNNWTATVDGLAERANGHDIAYTWEEADVPAGYQATVDGDTITNTHTPATISKTVTKQWVDNDNQDGIRPESIKVNLLANGQVVKTVELTAANNWTATIAGLAEKANGQDIAYTWEEAGIPAGYQASVDGNLITNTHTPATITKTVTKVWVDNDNQDGIRPESIKVNLLANGQVVKTAKLTAANNWTVTIDGLAEKANGQTITYTWEEADIPAGYQATVDGDLITNTHTPVTIAKTVTKQWVDNDNQDGIRPELIKVNLLANGQVVKTVELTAANHWTATVDGLAEKANGQTITYTWEEAELPAGYQVTVDGDTITNTYTPATITKMVTKQWVDNDNQDGLRPSSIKVNLLANGQVIKTIELTAANGWTATIDGLAEKAAGHDITYTWEEAELPAGYQATVDGDLITNTHTPATISKTVTKQWVDNDNQDGLRPSSIKVNLLANGQVVKTIELTATNHWTATVDGLAEKANGQNINYTWQEADVPAGYQATVDGDTIINTHAPLTTTVSITKVWNDADNQDGLRPASVTINLLANGQIIRKAELNAANNWRTEFADLMMYSHQGQQIIYTVEEADVPAGYQSTVSQDGMSFTVMNTHQPTTPTTPTTPDQPTTPTTPTTPDQPTTPTTPTTPDQPTTPTTPKVPSQPVTPMVPGQPSNPAQPSTPARQEQPQLPQTGNYTSFALIILGLALMTLMVVTVKPHD